MRSIAAHDRQEAAQDPILVEALDAVDRLLELVARSPRRRGSSWPSGIEAGPEQLAPSDRDLGVRRSASAPCSASENAIAAWRRYRATARITIDLAAGQPGREHQRIETVVLDLAAPSTPRNASGEVVAHRSGRRPDS